MRISAFALTSALSVLLLAPASIAQADGAPRRARSGRTKVLALKVGKIHTVNGPVIENGVIVVRGGRIAAVGKDGAVRIPRRAEVVAMPDAHVYPGIVDALSNAFTSRSSNSNRSTNAGTDFHDELDSSQKGSRELVQYGITTAFVGNRSSTTWRGLGAIVRPNANGYDLLAGHRHGGTSLRMTTGFGADHALDRLKRFDKTGNVFDGLEAYEKQQADYKKALADYAKKRKAYLDYFAKKKSGGSTRRPAGNRPGGAGKPATGTPTKRTTTPTGRPATGSPTGTRRPPSGEGRRGRTESGRGERTSRRGGFTRGSSRPGMRTMRGRTGSTPSRTKTSTDPKAPKKPKYPKKVKQDPAKEALLKVLNGKLPLRVEVHRKDEILAALFMAFTKELPGLTLEFATQAGDVAKEIAESGTSVVVTDLLPGSDQYTRSRDGSLPGKLDAAGVKVAIASGSIANARNLTMMAAYATGKGMKEAAAVRALTLTPAEILGIGDLVGSIEKNKLADLVITSGPLLKSDTRILRVLSKGETQYEAK